MRARGRGEGGGEGRGKQNITHYQEGDSPTS